MDVREISNMSSSVKITLWPGSGAVFLVPRAIKLLHHSISPLSWLYRDSANGGDFMGGEDPRWGGGMIIGFC